MDWEDDLGGCWVWWGLGGLQCSGLGQNHGAEGLGWDCEFQNCTGCGNNWVTWWEWVCHSWKDHFPLISWSWSRLSSLSWVFTSLRACWEPPRVHYGKMGMFLEHFVLWAGIPAGNVGDGGFIPGVGIVGGNECQGMSPGIDPGAAQVWEPWRGWKQGWDPRSGLSLNSNNLKRKQKPPKTQKCHFLPPLHLHQGQNLLPSQLPWKGIQSKHIWRLFPRH